VAFFWILQHLGVDPEAATCLFWAVLAVVVVGALGQSSGEGGARSRLIPRRPPAQYPPDWEDLRRQALHRDGSRCGNCGGALNLHVHHIVPLSKGGSNQLGNLRTLCDVCHKRLHPHMRD
jgi:hypothetical protein